MLKYNSSINVTKEYSELKLTVVEPINKINLRGKKRDFFTKIGKTISILPPSEPNTSSVNEHFSLLWLSPDEWMLYSNNMSTSINESYNLKDKLFSEISKVNYGSVTNVTDHWVMINIKGKTTYDLLSTSCPYNFNKFKESKGSVVQTILNHMDVIIHHKDINDLNIFVRRSFSNHFFSWIDDAASKM